VFFMSHVDSVLSMAESIGRVTTLFDISPYEHNEEGERSPACSLIIFGKVDWPFCLLILRLLTNNELYCTVVPF
jgi:hypothetical protein